jgi:putative zinc finger/helix-turn-helix YgiT family protein
MKCSECKKTMKAKKDVVPYPMAGIEFKLVGVPSMVCECGNKEIAIPAIKNLHLTIARIVISLEKISGEQIKFLRKFQGLTQRELGELIKIEPETISRWETNEFKPSEQSIIILKKLAVDHIANEWQELKKMMADLENEESEDVVESMKEFMQRMARQNLADGVREYQLRYKDINSTYVLLENVAR